LKIEKPALPKKKNSYLVQGLPDAKLVITSLADLFDILLTTTKHDPFIQRRHLEETVSVLVIRT